MNYVLFMQIMNRFYVRKKIGRSYVHVYVKNKKYRHFLIQVSTVYYNQYEKAVFKITQLIHILFSLYIFFIHRVQT